MSERQFEEMPTADPEGWTEWIHPLPGYLMKCCGCGLVHEMDARVGRVVERTGSTFEWDDLNALNGKDEVVVMFRMRREEDAP